MSPLTRAPPAAGRAASGAARHPGPAGKPRKAARRRVRRSGGWPPGRSRRAPVHPVARRSGPGPRRHGHGSRHRRCARRWLSACPRRGRRRGWEHKFLEPLVGEEEEQTIGYPPPPEKPKPVCRRCRLVRKKCRCSKRWKMVYWRYGTWKIDYRRALKRWRKAYEEWKQKYGK